MTEPQAIRSSPTLLTEVEANFCASTPQDSAGNGSAPAAVSLSPQQITRHSAVNMIGGIVSQGLKFLVVIYVARHFSTADFGIFSFAWAVYAFIFVLAHFGLPVLGTRQVAQRGRVSSALLANVAFSRAVLALAGTAVALLIFSLVPRITRTELYLLTLFGLSNVGSATLFDWAFQGLGRLEISAILNIIWQGSWLLFTFIGARMGGGIATVGIALCASAGLASLIGYVWLRRLPGTEHYSLSLWGTARDAWSTMRSGSALGVGTILITVLVWTDVIFVRLLKGELAAGIYSAGNRIALGLGMLAAFYVQGAFPLLTRTSSEQSHFAECFQRTYRDLAALFVPICIWAFVYAEPTIAVVFGRSEYSASVPIFRLFVPILLLYIGNTLFGTGVLVAFHKDSAFQRALTVSAAALLAACPILTHEFQIWGTAWSALLTQILCFAAFYIPASRLVNSHHLRALGAPLLAGFSVIGVSYLLRFSVLSSFVLLCGAYSVLLVSRSKRIKYQVAAQ